MRGRSFSGALSEGDQVRVSGRWRDGTLRADSLENLTTGAVVRANSYATVIVAVLAVLVAVVVVTILNQ